MNDMIPYQAEEETEEEKEVEGEWRDVDAVSDKEGFTFVNETGGPSDEQIARQELLELKTRQEIVKLEQLEAELKRREEAEKRAERREKSQLAAKGLARLATLGGVPMSSDQRHELYFGRANPNLYGGRPGPVGIIKTDKERDSLQALRDVTLPQRAPLGRPPISQTGDLSPLRQTTAFGGGALRQATTLSGRSDLFGGLSALRKAPDLSRLRNAQVPALLQRAQQAPTINVPLEPGETPVERFEDPVYFWIGNRQGWELGDEVWITQMPGGAYRFAGVGAKTGKRRSKTIGNDLGNAYAVAVKGPNNERRI